VAALYDLGEAEMAASLSLTVAQERAKRARKAAALVQPRAMERLRWVAVAESLSKLVADVVVWQVPAGAALGTLWSTEGFLLLFVFFFKRAFLQLHAFANVARRQSASDVTPFFK
jgi:hypothetical protein